MKAVMIFNELGILYATMSDKKGEILETYKLCKALGMSNREMYKQ